MKKNKIFLLGGSDLEMITIKELLLKEGCIENRDIFDKKLDWGAKLSSYSDELKKFSDAIIYGIELEEDITPPPNYQAIDHHNEKSSNPSSLEQIATLLNFTLNRYQELVSQNDVGHIEAMRSFGATDKEIADIRQKDRASQGVTKEDELLAQKEIASVEKENGVYVLETSLDKFSPLVDRFEKRPFLIYNKKSLTYYGNIVYLIEKYKEQIEKREAYHGRGYFGFDSAYLEQNNVQEITNEIVKLRDKNLFSYHTFMFPFIFNNKEEVSIDEKWKYREFINDKQIFSQKDFNEKNYFYKHVQDALFNDKPENEKEYISKYYEYEDDKGTYTIDCKKGKYSLELDGISLRVFKTDVAILSFHLINREHNEIEEILAINDFGRRTYPQFLGEDFTKDTKDACLAKSITLDLENIQKIIVEDFKSYDKKERLKDGVRLPSFISHLIDTSFKDIQYVIDDRMFVISQYHNDLLTEKMKCYDKEREQYEYEENDLWYQYIFLDGDGKTSQSRHLTKKLIKKSTYDRWVEWGTLFGISRYSFVVLTGSWYGKNRLLPHTQTMYFQMFSLLLAYRATMIKFADEIQDITQKEESEIVKGISSLYKNYLGFMNKLYFKEVTAQEQGIELYEQAMSIMKTESGLKDLDAEISELYNYVEILKEESRKKAEEKRNRKLEKISELGATYLPPTLLASLYGVNIFDFNTSPVAMVIGFLSMILVALLGYVAVRKKIIPPLISMALIPLVMLSSVYLIGSKSASEKKHHIQMVQEKEKK